MKKNNTFFLLFWSELCEQQLKNSLFPDLSEEGKRSCRNSWGGGGIIYQ